jgi:hypothetical protein
LSVVLIDIYQGENVENIVVKQDEQKPVPLEVLAESIKAISDGVRKLRAGPLNEGALILLIVHASPPWGRSYNRKKVTAKEVRAVLAGMESLEKQYLKKKPLPAERDPLAILVRKTNKAK